MQSPVPRPHAAPAISRGERVVRGTAIASAASLTAAASHALAGGQVTWLSVLATTLLALPLSTALAGRKFALWRLALAVGAAQFVYHWSFAGLGSFPLEGAGTTPASLHAAHLAQLQGFVPDLPANATATTAGLAMLLGHTVAAAVTIALLHSGDRALRAIARLVRRVVPFSRAVTVTALRVSRVPAPAFAWCRPRPALFSVISHRGPPRAA
ncbi:hypothetical protein JOF28_002816 [Leucobacter exalbidus]|uniref:Uncharacterized protein n=1 Tax=Leucobacter exalbidus TaxID=662960 RepID=A0A940T583_9MICO|nr:hypothetical protein [Leucobacter exalbidus]MBP1327584.1 hypothetical protein [Leucobacter exalbidus]